MPLNFSSPDPTVRVVGVPGEEAAVERACAELNQLFDTRSNRINLKVRRWQHGQASRAFMRFLCPSF